MVEGGEGRGGVRDGLKSTIRLWPIIASGRTDLSKTVIGDVVRREADRGGEYYWSCVSVTANERQRDNGGR